MRIHPSTWLPLAALTLLGLTGSTMAQTQGVQVQFRNATNKEVRFFLTGVDNPYKLNAGATNSFGMAQKSGAVEIVQADGTKIGFTVEGGGKYAFADMDGKIVSNFDNFTFIKLQIFNRTNKEVVFSINGGKGTGFKLPVNDGGDYSVQVDDGVAPQITVSQADGGRLNFRLEADKKYVLRETGGKVELALDASPQISDQPPQQRVWTAASPPKRAAGESVGSYLEWVENNRVFNDPKIVTEKGRLSAANLNPQAVEFLRHPINPFFQQFNSNLISTAEKTLVLSEIVTFERWRLLGPPTYTTFDTKLTTWKAVTVSRSQRDELKATLAASAESEAGFRGIATVKASVEAAIEAAISYESGTSKKENFSMERTTKADTWNLEWVRERVVIVRGLEEKYIHHSVPTKVESVYVFPASHQEQVQLPGEGDNIGVKFSQQNAPAFYGRTPPRVVYFNSYEDFFAWQQSVNGVFYGPMEKVENTKMPYSEIRLQGATPVGNDGKELSTVDVRVTMRRRWRLVETKAYDQGAIFRYSLANTKYRNETDTLAARIKSTASVEAFGVTGTLSAEIEGSRTLSKGLETSNGIDREYTVPDKRRILTWVLEREVKFEVLNRLVAGNGAYNGPNSVSSIIYLGRFDDVSAKE